MSAKQASSVLWRGKLEALSKGQHTADCVFLVGPDEETAELIHACSEDLKIASEVFTAMLKDEWRKSKSDSIRIKQIEPRAFKLLVEFTHVYNLCSDHTIMDLVNLAVAADHFIIQPLVLHCATLIQDLVQVDNVWSILNATHHIPEIVSVCSRVLSLQTLRCIESPSFLQVSAKGIVPFLQMENLTVNSEMVLVNACLKVANSRIFSTETKTSDFMRAAIPHLRLLVLQVDQIAMLARYLTEEERSVISRGIVFKEYLPMLATLNSSRSERHPGGKTLAISIIPDDTWLPSDPRDVITLNVIHSAKSEMSRLMFHSLENISLDGLEILTRANGNHRCKASNRFEPEPRGYTENLEINISYVTTLDDPASHDLHNERIVGKRKFNSWFKHTFESAIFFPKGVDCIIDLNTVASSAYLKTFDKCADKSNLETIKNYSEGAFESPHLLRYSSSFAGKGNEEWEEVENDSSFIIKKIYVSLVN